MDSDEEVNGRGWEMVEAGARAATAASYDGDDFSVFPPSLHEGLTATLTLDSPSPSVSPSLAASASVEGLEESKLEEEEEHHLSRTRISEAARRLVDSGIDLVRSKLAALRGGGRGGCDGGAVWSFAAVAGFAGILMYMRRRHRREKQLLLFMILEKDERINQLMDQIVRMSKAITANYKVHVATRT